MRLAFGAAQPCLAWCPIPLHVDASDLAVAEDARAGFARWL